MISSEMLAAGMRTLVAALEWPVMAVLLGITALAVLESGLAIGERWLGLRRWRDSGRLDLVEQLAHRRIERVDMLAKVGPMLGLMGTLIPLGPGLAALGGGDLTQLAQALIKAFDTTVLGLVVGACGYVLGKWRRRWYGACLDAMEQRQAEATP
ncbi:MotA/TolQ/ExbB proton channel family protein [Vogesella indigofera]|uniref:MotA/TolQ/ExbB proton channel family protein n=1 Tax=Vogesella indigofera TaxID=45465 RepID=UPI00234EBD2F|nr:MotA/TolQ/ExbB proton channel family protein [Vogesella indigofera]MDC7706333.1 MotA/TolQ/ExbB proton channel family protein [Vogesella indigofera]